MRQTVTYLTVHTKKGLARRYLRALPTNNRPIFHSRKALFN